MTTTDFPVHMIPDKVMRQVLYGVSVIVFAVIMGLLNLCKLRLHVELGLQNLQFSAEPGLKFELRWDYLNQDQLRHGTGTISPAAASQIMNNGMPQEVEKYTRNNFLTLGVDYSKSPDGGINVQVPYIFRSHGTLGTKSNGFVAGPGGGQYNSYTSSISDIRRYNESWDATRTLSRNAISAFFSGSSCRQAAIPRQGRRLTPPRPALSR